MMPWAGGMGGGAVVSTVHVRMAGGFSVLPIGSVAKTLKAWMPSTRSVKLTGEEQAAKAASSREQLKLDPTSEAAKANVAVVCGTLPLGPAVIVVWGGVVSGP